MPVEVKLIDFKNLKFVKTIKNLSPKLKWFMFKSIQDYKIGSKYIDFLIPEENKEINKDSERLEKMVEETLIKEFGPKVKDMKSYNLLVDAVVHNLKKKQLKGLDDIEDDI